MLLVRQAKRPSHNEYSAKKSSLLPDYMRASGGAGYPKKRNEFVNTSAFTVLASGATVLPPRAECNELLKRLQGEHSRWNKNGICQTASTFPRWEL